jgi:predicted oxidoreductase
MVVVEGKGDRLHYQFSGADTQKADKRETVIHVTKCVISLCSAAANSNPPRQTSRKHAVHSLGETYQALCTCDE